MLRLITAAILAAALAALPMAHAQGSDEISGHYRDAKIGIVIDFPKGWTGSDKLGFPLVSPTGFVEGGKWPAANMAILSTSSIKAREMWQDPAYRYSLNDDAACKELSRSYVIISKVRASEVVKECDDSDYSKTKTYAIATLDNIIVIRFSASSSKEYASHIGEFDGAIKTLQVYKALDMKNAIRTLSNMQSLQDKVSVDGAQVTIKIDTTSKVSNIQLYKNSFSFDVSGKKDTRGVAEASIGFLKGPYRVTVDGKQTGDFKVTSDRTTGETLLSVNYSHDARHRITITGVL
ncbi:MAG: hypothetical protein ABI347_07370 [Nitrososphaera sp.]|jgi:hypothetical protein